MAKKADKLKAINRRTFIKYLGTGLGTGVVLSLPGRNFLFQGGPNPVPPDRRVVSNSTLNLYRSEFATTRGSSQGFSPHCVNCKGNCAWQTFEKGGRLLREEQFAGYPQIAPDIPDANPRGCNKGALHSQTLYEKDRLLYPLKRAGARGEGKWKRISWDAALDEIGKKVVGLLSQRKFEQLMVYAGTGVLSPVRRAASLRLASLLGAVRFNVASAVGDMFPGATIAYGLSTVGCTSEAWYTADYVLIWGINPSVSRIPDAHYLWEGRYRGTRVVTISPDYSPTARQSSLWIPLKPGTDSYLAMSLVNVILEEGLYKKRFIREQTDLPFLVKVSDGRLLRQSDMFKGGNKEIFYFYDKKTKRPVEAKGSKGSTDPTLRLDVRPALEGVFEVRDGDGKTIKVTPVFALIKKEAKKFTPEKTQIHTGIHPSVVRREAKKFARSKVALIMQGYRIHKYFWGTLVCWGAALLLALTGHAGRKGGLDIDNEWGLGSLGVLSGPKPGRLGSGFLGEWRDGGMHQSLLSHLDDDELRQKSGLTKNELVSLADKAVKKEGFAYYGKPKVMILFHDNKFVRNAAQEQSEKAVLEGVDLYVNVNYRLDSSALLADIVLPTLTNYESWEMRLDPGYCRFANIMVPPSGLKVPGEAKSEWEICTRLAKKIQNLARKRDLPPLPDPELRDPAGKQVLDPNTKKVVIRDLKRLYKDFVMVEPPLPPGAQKPPAQKTFGPITDERTLLEWVMSKVPAVAGWNLAQARKSGFFVLGKVAGQTSPLYPDKPFFPFEPQVYLKQPYATVSGRQQFYVDHDLYLKMGCAVPTAREPVRPSRYPLAYYNPHTRYGIHSTWRSSKYHLRLQRGVPYLCLNPKTAAQRGIKDGDQVRVYNDVGEVFFMAKVHPGTPPGSVWTEHAWENFQFTKGKGVNNVYAGIIAPMELAGNWGHLVHGAFWDGNQLKETSVEVEKV